MWDNRRSEVGVPWAKTVNLASAKLSGAWRRERRSVRVPVGDGGGSALGGAGGIAPTVLWEARQNSGAPPYPLGLLLRIHLQQWYSLSDGRMEEG